MSTYPVTDDYGHTYATEQEVDDGIDFLEADAAYLYAQVDKYRDAAVKERVKANAENSKSYAKHLRNIKKTAKKVL